MTNRGRNHGSAHWRRSSYTLANSNCVEFAVQGAWVVLRDSKNPTRGTIRVTAAAWRAFVDTVKGDELPRGSEPA